MDELSNPGARHRVPAGPFPPYPADQLEKEQAVFDLTDAGRDPQPRLLGATST